MRKEKGAAIKLRNTGKSYAYISQVLKIPKSTLSDWFSHEEWSLTIKHKLQEQAKTSSKNRIKSLNVARQIRLEELYLEADEQAEQEFTLNKNDSLFIAGLMLYWGEGDKKFENGRVKVANTDPRIIKIFRNFLIKFGSYSLENIKGWLLLYPDLNVDQCLSYWADKGGILKSNFIKSTIIQGRHKNNRLNYGTCTIHVTNKYLKKKILKWINLYGQELVKIQQLRE